ncbi:ER membrane glycoprotein subunit of the GPI transamidase complex-like protein [Batrachochytrium dendrobatidis]|nr:ER membrane glycoprotein subunit of the GPI transamidase complex-like protein [Batrachochytrium dendrobatidis]
MSTVSFVRSHTGQVLLLAMASRILYILIVALSTFTTTEYDTSATHVLAPSTIAACSTPASQILLTLKRLVRWDAVYFLGIAEQGYTYEQQFAFFPGLPLLMQAATHSLSSVFGSSVCNHVLLVISGILISNTCFVMATVALYKLSAHVLHDNHIAFVSAILFAFNPAGIFMSSIYTESPFALCAFMGMLNMVQGHTWAAALWWSGASSLRGNGILFAGFFIWDLLHPFAKHTIQTQTMYRIVRNTIALGVVVAPFILFQYYGWTLFCTENADTYRPWCNHRIPSIYSFVQAHYWNNGLFKYYTAQQIPNFFLAAPYLIVSCTGITQFALEHWTEFISVGFMTKKLKRPYSVLTLLPFVYLWMVMLGTCALFMHVQVILRFFTSSPVLFWVLAKWTVEWNGKSMFIRLLGFYYTAYPVIGAVLFANFLPPA